MALQDMQYIFHMEVEAPDMAEPWKNGNVNDLCSLDYADPMTGFVLIKSVPCRVEKV